MMDNFEKELREYQKSNNIFSKGKLSVVIQLTRMFQGKPFPLSPDEFKTEKEGQVAGLGGGNLKKILKEHGIPRRILTENYHDRYDRILSQNVVSLHPAIAKQPLCLEKGIF